MMDSDIELMSTEELRNNLQKAREVVRWMCSQEGDDACWLDYLKVAQEILPHGSINFELPAEEDFLKNCKKFWQTRDKKCLKLHEW